MINMRCVYRGMVLPELRKHIPMYRCDDCCQHEKALTNDKYYVVTHIVMKHDDAAEIFQSSSLLFDCYDTNHSKKIKRLIKQCSQSVNKHASFKKALMN